MATEFKTVLDHGTYVLNALVKSDSKTVELFLVGERDGDESRIVEGDGKSFYSFEMRVETADVDVFRKEYLNWLETGGKDELEVALNPISVFNLEAAVAEEFAAEPEEVVVVEEKPVVKAAAPKKAAAKRKPKAK